MNDPRNTTVIHGSGNNTTITVETPRGTYTFDDSPNLDYVIERHGEKFAREEAERRVPDWEERCTK